MTSPRIDTLRPDDLPELPGLCRQTGWCGPEADRDWLHQRLWGDATVAAELLLAARQEGALVGLAVGCVRQGLGVIKAFGVREGWRRRGIATRLLDELEARLAQRGLARAFVGGVGPHFFATGISLRHTGAIAFLMRRGYTTDRYARVDMQVDLMAADLACDAALARLATEGIAVRRAQPAELENIANFAAESFDPAWGLEVLDAGRGQPAPRLWLALDAGRLVAFAAHGAIGPAHFGPIGTLPAYRGRGIGSALLKLCLQDLRAAGYPVCRIAWAGPVDYYARVVGAQITDAFWCFAKPLPGA